MQLYSTVSMLASFMQEHSSCTCASSIDQNRCCYLHSFKNPYIKSSLYTYTVQLILLLIFSFTTNTPETSLLIPTHLYTMPVTIIIEFHNLKVICYCISTNTQTQLFTLLCYTLHQRPPLPTSHFHPTVMESIRRENNCLLYQCTMLSWWYSTNCCTGDLKMFISI